MPETPPEGFQNKKLLVVAFLLGVVFVVLFNVQGCIEARRRAENQMDFVLIKMDLGRGAVLDQTNVEKITLPRDVAQEIRGLVEFHRITLGQTKVTIPVEKNNLLRKAEIRERAGDAQDVLRDLKDDERTVKLDVGKLDAPMAFLQPKSRVDIYGVLATVRGRAPRATLIMENVEITSVGDGRKGAGNVRAVSVKIKKNILADLMEVLRRVQGRLTLAVRRGSGDPDDTGTLTPAAKMALDLPARPDASGGPGFRIDQ